MNVVIASLAIIIFSVSPLMELRPITYDPEVLKWLDEQLAAITKAEPEKVCA
jgi:hypothetical protein